MRAALPLVIPTALIGASFGVAAVTTDWGTLALEYMAEEPPSTELGRIEAEWLARSARA